jgi:hypothetical protein
VITDEAISEALSAANTAKAMADGKSTVYASVPDSPKEGDLLIPTSNSGSYKAGKVYKCDDNGAWVEIEYTDDTKADAVQSALEVF